MENDESWAIIVVYWLNVGHVATAPLLDLRPNIFKIIFCAKKRAFNVKGTVIDDIFLFGSAINDFLDRMRI